MAPKRKLELFENEDDKDVVYIGQQARTITKKPTSKRLKRLKRSTATVDTLKNYDGQLPSLPSKAIDMIIENSLEESLNIILNTIEKPIRRLAPHHFESRMISRMSEYFKTLLTLASLSDQYLRPVSQSIIPRHLNMTQEVHGAVLKRSKTNQCICPTVRLCACLARQPEPSDPRKDAATLKLILRMIKELEAIQARCQTMIGWGGAVVDSVEDH